MTPEQIGGIVRTIMATGAGYAIGQGWVDEPTATAIAGAVTTIVVAVWSYRAKRR